MAMNRRGFLFSSGAAVALASLANLPKLFGQEEVVAERWVAGWQRVRFRDLKRGDLLRMEQSLASVWVVTEDPRAPRAEDPVWGAECEGPLTTGEVSYLMEQPNQYRYLWANTPPHMRQKAIGASRSLEQLVTRDDIVSDLLELGAGSTAPGTLRMTRYPVGDKGREFEQIDLTIQSIPEQVRQDQWTEQLALFTRWRNGESVSLPWRAA